MFKYNPLPGWLRGVYGRFKVQMKELSIIHGMSLASLGKIPGLFIKAGDSMASQDEQATEQLLDWEKRQEEFDAVLQSEIDQGFPLLNGVFVVRLWGVLEASVRDIVLAIVLHDRRVIQVDEFSRIRVPLAQYQAMEPVERAEWLVAEFEQQTRAYDRRGVGRFEAMLKPLGLAGSINPQVKRDLFELSQVRNVIVHRAGIVDQRFREACPWYGVEVGERLSTSSKDFHRYWMAVLLYMLTVMLRLQGGDERQEREMHEFYRSFLAGNELSEFPG